jgi:hypothetical protein
MRLTDYPFPIVNVSCQKCQRRGRYKKKTLIDQYGGDIAGPDLRWKIAEDCPRAAKRQLGTDPCGIVFPDLLKRYREEIEAEKEC